MSSSPLRTYLRDGIRKAQTSSTITLHTSRQLRRSREHLVDRFLSRQERSPSAFFDPIKGPESGRWRPGLLSLRRQSQLASIAFAQGRLHEINRGSSKVQKLEKRMAEAKTDSDVPENAVYWARQDVESKTRMEMKRLANVHSRQLIASKGPYSGRKGPAFKGTKQQRQLRARKEDVRRRVGGMDKVIETWRLAKKEIKDKAQSSLPF